MAYNYTLKISVTSHLQISIPEIKKYLLHSLENKRMHGYNAHRFEGVDNINLIGGHDIIAPFPSYIK